MYAVSNVTRFCVKLTEWHWTAVKSIMRYLNGILNPGTLYSKKNSKDCIGYSYVDWAGDLDDTNQHLDKCSRLVEQLQTGGARSKLCGTVNC